MRQLKIRIEGSYDELKQYLSQEDSPIKFQHESSPIPTVMEYISSYITNDASSKWALRDVFKADDVELRDPIDVDAQEILGIEVKTTLSTPLKEDVSEQEISDFVKVQHYVAREFGVFCTKVVMNDELFITGYNPSNDQTAVNPDINISLPKYIK